MTISEKDIVIPVQVYVISAILTVNMLDHFREGYCHPGTGVCYKCDTNCQYAAFYLKEQLARKTQECEELKKEIINKNEKIKELRFSVSDLTNRLCYLNAEKSFRIVDLEQTLDEIEKELKEDIYCENQECGCDDFEECLKCTKEHILAIITKAKKVKYKR